MTDLEARGLCGLRTVKCKDEMEWRWSIRSESEYQDAVAKARLQ